MPHEPPPSGTLHTGDQHASHLVALIADAALKDVNLGKTMDIVVFMDNKCLSVAGRRMHVAGQDATPIPGPQSPESDGLFPLLAQHAKRLRKVLHLVKFTMGIPIFSLSS